MSVELREGFVVKVATPALAPARSDKRVSRRSSTSRGLHMWERTHVRDYLAFRHCLDNRTHGPRPQTA